MKRFELSLVALVVLCWAGCKTPEGPYVAVANPGSPEAAGAPVVLLNSDLRRTMAVDKPVVIDRDAENRLRVQVGLRNRSDLESLQVQVQTLWKDETGRILYNQIGSEMPWQTITLSKNQTVYYSQTALTPEATKFSIRVRYTAGAK